MSAHTLCTQLREQLPPTATDVVALPPHSDGFTHIAYAADLAMVTSLQDDLDRARIFDALLDYEEED